MKTTLTLLFLTLALGAFSQLWRSDRHMILIRNNHTHRLIKITTNAGITVQVKGKHFDGTVREISADTVFLKDTLFRVRDIDTLFLDNPIRKPNPFSQGRRSPDYVAGSANWQVFIPPESVYDNPRMYHDYLQSIESKTRHDKVADSGPMLYHNFLKFNLAKLAHLELAFSYDRYIAKHFYWETELSVIFGIQTADAYYQIPYPVFNYNGFSVTTYPKFYLGKTHAYLSPVVMYRYLWFNGVRTDWPEQQHNGMLQDQYRNDLALSLRLGYSRRNGQFVMDFYFGGGIKYIFLHQLVYGDYRYHDSGQMHWRHPDHSPDVYDKQIWQAVVNLGIKIGFGF